MTRKDAIETLRRKVKLYSALAYAYKMVRKDQGLNPGHHPCRATLTGLHCGLAVLRGRWHVQFPGPEGYIDKGLYLKAKHRVNLSKALHVLETSEATYQALQMALEELK